MNQLKNLFLVFMLLLAQAPFSKAFGQRISSDKVLKINELPRVLKKEVRDQLKRDDKLSEEGLAAYLRLKFSERFFYDYKTIDKRMEQYTELYANQSSHRERAEDHMGKYEDSTQWVLPFNYLDGTPVNAYALRHLARQHKMVDIAFLYFGEQKDPKYIRYFVNQMRSLNTALTIGQYEKIEDGNGVYEVFRSGYRVMNWLWIHNMFLSQDSYTDKDQLTTIATLLQHGQDLYEENSQFRAGNHQTRGMSALAVLSILLRDFEGTDRWMERAMLRLSEHLDKEINPDGFQFERSVHYHMSDINNYFYVYQLAKINQIKVEQKWEEQLRSLFVSLAKIAYPDKSAPVLQDDTEIPWGEKNDISGAMTLGYLLFENAEFGYFASDRVDERMYWYLSQSQVEQLDDIEQKKPSYGSLSFPDTHYYVMRQGWEASDKMMVVSAGLDKDKPDHQHGDMLGIQAMANGQVILPNYQVRYSLKDFELFKNSMVKNVALVDDQLQGKEWTSNKGGSGFGKFKMLPNPKVLAWKSNDAFDLFIGEHDGFENVGVAYSRQVIYVKNDFWIVKDNFRSEKQHEYKQIWQGHYTNESNPNLIRATFPDAAGCDILQLRPSDEIQHDGVRGKHWTVMSKRGMNNFDFVTVIFPYTGYSNRIDEFATQTDLKGWLVNQSKLNYSGANPIVISKDSEYYFFGVQRMEYEEVAMSIDHEADVYLQIDKGVLKVQLISDKDSEIQVFMKKEKDQNSRNVKLVPGQEITIDMKQ